MAGCSFQAKQPRPPAVPNRASPPRWESHYPAGIPESFTPRARSLRPLRSDGKKHDPSAFQNSQLRESASMTHRTAS